MANHMLIRSTLTALARLGVAEICVAAGARNAPLIAALTDSDGIKLWSFFEERCAAFFALGRILADRSPVAVLTTSGTAAAELLPAVIEAYYQGLPLIVVTADRPRRFRGSGAPQAIEQKDLFGPYVAACLDVEAGVSIAWPTRMGLRPLHINIALDEPLDHQGGGIDFLKHPGPKPAKAVPPPAFALPPQPSAVLVSGLTPADANAAAPVLSQLGLPIFAEATSNLWGAGADHPDLPALLPADDRTLRSFDIRHVLRLGGVPTSRWWRDLENDSTILVTNISRLDFPGLARQERVQTLPWSCLKELPRRRLPAAQRFEDTPDISDRAEAFPLSEPAWVHHIARSIPAASRVFLGNSLPIREFNSMAGSLEHRLDFYANRGANGIDGLISTWLGVSASSRESWLIVGDLSALYDLAAPWIMPQLPKGNRRLVILNNGGGKIFSQVASLRALSPHARQLIENHHGVGFAPWAEMWGLPYAQLTAPNQLHDLPDGPLLLEIRPDPGQTDAFHAHP